MPNVITRHKSGHPPVFRVTIMETTLTDRSTQRVLPLIPAILLAMLVGLNLRPSMAAIGLWSNASRPISPSATRSSLY